MPNPQEDFTPTRESLINRLKDLSDDEIWEHFFKTYRPLIFSVAKKAGLNEEAAKDIVQETFISAKQHLPDFCYDAAIGSFKGWLLRITRCRIVDAIRKTHYKYMDQPVKREEPLGSTLMERQVTEEGGPFDKIWDEEWRLNLIQTAMDRVKKRVNGIHFQMFYLHVHKGIAASDVAKRFQTNLSAVYFAKYRVSAQLKKEIRKLDPPK